MEKWRWNGLGLGILWRDQRKESQSGLLTGAQKVEFGRKEEMRNIGETVNTVPSPSSSRSLSRPLFLTDKTQEVGEVVIISAITSNYLESSRRPLTRSTTPTHPTYSGIGIRLLRKPCAHTRLQECTYSDMSFNSNPSLTPSTAKSILLVAYGMVQASVKTARCLCNNCGSAIP